MVILCPQCGERLEIEGHMEAAAGAKCPNCSHVFSGTESSPPAEGKLRFVAGGEMDPSAKRKPNLGSAVSSAPARVLPSECTLGDVVSDTGAGVLIEAEAGDGGGAVLLRRFRADGVLPEDAERWAATANKLVGVRHSRLVTVLGVGPLEGETHAVVELAAGRPLDDFTSGRPLGFRQAAQISLHVSEALAAAHRSGVVHGNLKPSNIIVDSQGRARVCDFGYYPTAIVDGEPVQSDHVMRWMPCAPPEAIHGGLDKGAESADSYALGALLYYMLTGRPPFSAGDSRTLMTRVLADPPTPPGTLNPKIPEALEALIMRSLDKDPDRRPANAQAFALEVRRIEREGLLMKAPARRRAGGRRRVLVAFLALLVLGIGGYAVATRLQTSAAISRAELLVGQAELLDADDYDGRLALLRQAADAAASTAEKPRFQLKLARVYIEAGLENEATRVLANAVSSGHPASDEARRMYAEVAAGIGMVGEAIEQWGLILGKNPAAAAAVVETGVGAADSLVAGMKHDEAVELIEYILPLARQEGVLVPEARLALGRARLSLGQRDLARPEFVAVLEDRAGREVMSKAAVALVETVDSRASDFELTPGQERLLSASPYAQARYIRILVCRGLNERARSIAAEIDSAVISDARAAAWVALASAELREATGDMEGARLGFERATASTDSGAAALARAGLGRLELRSGRFQAANTIFTGAQRQFGQDPDAREGVACALVGQGDVLRVLGQPDESARKYREATGDIYKSYRRQYLAALCGLGELAMETRDTSRMSIVFRSLESEPDAGFFGKIARTMTGRMSESELAEAAILESRDAAARAYYCIGLRKELLSDPAGAGNAYARAVEASGDISWHRFLAGARMENRD